MTRDIDLRVAGWLSILYAFIITLSPFKLLFAAFIVPYVLLKFKDYMESQYNLNIRIYIILLISIEVTWVSVSLLQLIYPENLITLPMNIFISLLYVIKGFLFIMLVVKLSSIYTNLNKMVKLILYAFTLVGVHFIMIGAATNLPLLKILQQISGMLVIMEVISILHILQPLLFLSIGILFITIGQVKAEDAKEHSE